MRRTKGDDKIIIRKFEKIDQIIKIFPARNLKAEYFSLKTDERLGLRRDEERQEIFGVLQGMARVQIDDEVYDIGAGKCIVIPRGAYRDVMNENRTTLHGIKLFSKIEP